MNRTAEQAVCEEAPGQDRANRVDGEEVEDYRPPETTSVPEFQSRAAGGRFAGREECASRA